MPLGFPLRLAVCVVVTVFALFVGEGPTARAADTPATPTGAPETGFPIRSDVVKKACGACHASDATGAMSRISWRRTTPEGWQETIKRMATLNHAPLEPAEAREVLRYLANELGLAPEEVRPARFEVERRQIEFRYANRDTERTCGICHSIGRAMLQRRSSEEWDLLVAMHRGYYPLVDFQGFRLTRPPPREPGPDGKPPDRRQPVDKSLEHLKAAYPLRTAEWSDWSANRRVARLAGRWALSGYEPGRGPVFGEVKIEAKPGTDDEFVTEVRYAHAASASAPGVPGAAAGQPLLRVGQAMVYTGFQWRGRSLRSASSATVDEPLREVMLVERDGRSMSGRWFSGGYDETGKDVTLTRIGSEPLVLGLYPRALRAGTTAAVRVFGANLERVTAAQLDLGPGVRVKSVAAAADGLAAELETAAGAPVGERDLVVASTSSPRAAVVYQTVDALKVTPEPGLARVGGIRFPKQLEQFEARAWSYGPDGKRDTKDDLDLGAVPVAWSLEEFTATFGDDDTRWSGAIDANGLFTPTEDGPNPKRSGDRNNVGDVWVVATLPADSPWKPRAPLRARAHLIVTVPLYVRWDQPEVMP
jgi:quinohemoprotein amine dehydrogenase